MHNCINNSAGGLGLVYLTLRDYKGALHCFSEQIKILKTYAAKDCGEESPIQHQHLAIPYHNLAHAYRKLNHRAVSLRFAKVCGEL